ncbi:unnamed protein product [Protopolystoma xenopodis]|uniref:Transcriptional coactivator p15 (PC4) C-terminal domain-containing protein n=1 Tax=Protopolystoma xenopodis TaxID=117903 RepID=A0A448WD01_9PLAT|nr:unnamed protein product [Protopolystoma xenopodis]
MSSKKHKRDSDGDSLSSLSEDESPKKTKKPVAASVSGRTKPSDGSQMIDLTGNKYISVREFKSRIYVDIREFYDSSGVLKPGKKGVFLNVEQWAALKKSISEVDNSIKNFPR